LVSFPNCWWEIAPTRVEKHPLILVFVGNPGLARLLNSSWHRPPDIGWRLEKGRMTMSGSNLQRQLLAAFAALLMSTVAVGAAIGPATAVAAPAVTVSA